MVLERYSSRGLQVFLHDASVIAPHSRRPNQHILFHRQRLTSAQLSVRRVHAATSASTDDSHIPFELTPEQQQFQESSLSEISSRASEVKRAEIEKPDADWHAEIELATPLPEQSSESYPSFPELESLPEVSESPETSAVDDISLQGLNLSTVSPERDDVAAPMIAAPGSLAISGAGKQPKTGKTASRLDRKLRRIEEGKYKRASLAQRETSEENTNGATALAAIVEEAFEDYDDEESQRQAVLDHIGKMPGPDIPQPAPKIYSGERVRGDEGTSLPSKTSNKQREGKEGRSPSKHAKENLKDKKAELERRRVTRKPERDSWQLQKNALRDKFAEKGWQPRKRLSPDTLDGIRALHASDPMSYTTEVIAQHFAVSPENIRRILKSKWRPNEYEAEERRVRWERRGIKKWQEMADNEGMRPPAKWRALGVTSAERTPEGKPVWRKKSETNVDDGVERNLEKEWNSEDGSEEADAGLHAGEESHAGAARHAGGGRHLGGGRHIGGGRPIGEGRPIGGGRHMDGGRPIGGGRHTGGGRHGGAGRHTNAGEHAGRRLPTKARRKPGPMEDIEFPSLTTRAADLGRRLS